ncbi:MAG: hypothetical protein Q9216_003746 [Gyalolechia sp. 2 TL-2023]
MGSLSKGDELKRNGWYHDLPDSELINETVQELFEKYSQIERENVLPHILSIHPSYPQVLAALKDSAHPFMLLDLGCCFGQDIRKLVYDGAPSEKLVACDLNSKFFDMGYELFRDRERLKTPMLAGDIFRDDGPLAEMQGKLDFVHASLFLHLFTWEKQVEASKQIIKLLKPQPGSIVLGRQTGNMLAQERRMPSLGNAWRHNEKSFRKMWEQVGVETETRWDIWVKADEMEGKHEEARVCFLTFEVRRE